MRKLRKLRKRSIPAWAGETEQAERQAANLQVYPRVGGGNQAGARDPIGGGGLSPRGRGKPR